MTAGAAGAAPADGGAGAGRSPKVGEPAPSGTRPRDLLLRAHGANPATLDLSSGPIEEARTMRVTYKDAIATLLLAAIVLPCIGRLA